MSHRLDIELTSQRPDGDWTWRAAGARQPKGQVAGSLVPDGAAVGDVLRAEANHEMEGIVLESLQAPAAKALRDDGRLEVIGSGRDDGPAVQTHLVERKGRGPRRDRDDDRRGDGRGRGRGRDGGRDGGRGQRSGGERDRSDRPSGGGRGRGRGDRPTDRPDRSPGRRNESTAPPRAPRLKAGKAHRRAAVAALAEVHRPLAEQVARGGVPAVRSVIDRYNEQARAEGRPALSSDPLVSISERLLPYLRAAEWRDRADAALAGVSEVDLRDLRSVVVAADASARDDETRALAEQLKQGLSARVETEHAAWLDELRQLVADERVVRALKVSSRPPKAGSPLPGDLAATLVAAASASLTADTGSDRFIAVVDALAASPVRAQVAPQGVPERGRDDITKAVKKLADRVPRVAAAVTPPPATGSSGS